MRGGGGGEKSLDCFAKVVVSSPIINCHARKKLLLQQKGKKNERGRFFFFTVSCRSKIARPLQFSRDQISLAARESDTCVCLPLPPPHPSSPSLPTKRRRRDSRKAYFSVSATSRELNSRAGVTPVYQSPMTRCETGSRSYRISVGWRFARERKERGLGWESGEAEETKDSFFAVQFPATLHKMALKNS